MRTVRSTNVVVGTATVPTFVQLLQFASPRQTTYWVGAGEPDDAVHCNEMERKDVAVATSSVGGFGPTGATAVVVVGAVVVLVGVPPPPSHELSTRSFAHGMWLMAK